MGNAVIAEGDVGRYQEARSEARSQGQVALSVPADIASRLNTNEASLFYKRKRRAHGYSVVFLVAHSELTFSLTATPNV